MSIDDLRERIREEIILHEGNVAAWEWQQKGLVSEAAQLQLSPEEFYRLVNYLSNTVAPDFGRLSDLKLEIIERYRLGQALSPEELNAFVRKAEQLQLNRAFVVDRWIPVITKGLPRLTDAGKKIDGNRPPAEFTAKPAQPPRTKPSVAASDKTEEPVWSASVATVADKKIDQNWAISIVTILGLIFAFGIYKTMLKPGDPGVQAASVMITPVESKMPESPAASSSRPEGGVARVVDRPAVRKSESPDRMASARADYDAIDESERGELGEYKARKGDKWGLWRSGKWLISPEYSDIDLFRNGRARISNNGAESYLDVTGSPITDPDVN